MRLPNNITARPDLFWPFVIADFGFGGVSGVLLALGQYNWAELVIWIGIPPNLYFAFPALFNPSFAVRKGYLRPGVETVWARNAGLLIFIITGYHVVAAIDAERFEAVAWGTVAGRLAAGIYWVIVAKTEPMRFDSEPDDEKAAGLSSPTMADGLHHANVQGSDLRYFRAGTGTPVVLLHTLRTQLEYFEPLIRELDLGRMEVFALDLPGHGESAAPRVDYTAAYFTDAVEGFLEACDINGAIVAGDSIGASIGLLMAARRNPRVRGVVAVNTYDYGHWGGVRRNSLLANVLFTTLLLPGVGAAAVQTEMAWQIRRVVRSGLHDPDKLPPDLVFQMHRCGSLLGHPRAFRSLLLEWKSWIDAREQYSAIEVPVTLAYGDGDWANAEERAANARAIPEARAVTIQDAGHFASLDKPEEVAGLIRDAL
jgi:pimeloyl-ACP methyl ester carboxylesterase